ncbi:MAG: hypothetical protein ABI823_00905 [Bryobacteraceae bacterium]
MKFTKTLAALVIGAGMAMSAMAADVVVRIGPPRGVSERHGRAPGRDYVWVQGYQNWNGRGYVWVPGRWERPPHRGARWQAHRWVKRNGGWVLVDGRWR